MKSLLVSIAVFLLLCGTILFLVFMYLTDQAPRDVINDINNSGKLFLYKYGMVEKLSSNEITRLYKNTCTRKCHGKDVIEKKPRTAAEWESVITRMKAPDRAGITDRHAETITRYLQSHFLSNVPTVLPEKTMKFLKRYLWKSDFGESDLFLDVIYVPREHLRLLPYLGVRKTQPDQKAAIFIVYINTHQGSVPPWNLAEMATLHDGNGHTQKATGWEVLYQDGQGHHNQGTLSFPDIDTNKATELEIKMSLPGLGMRTFQWSLPIPPLPEGDPVEH
ncbi:MAG: hypothetical protein NUV63_10145 [Gallionella sp.]|nr:hypothetical protein [Gallionella sp.]